MKYYRRVNVVQRQRRAVWEPQHIRIDEVGQNARYTEQSESEQMLATHVTEYLGANEDTEDFEQFGDDVDRETFEQMLDYYMDDDELEREFSRIAILGALPGMELMIRNIQDQL